MTMHEQHDSQTRPAREPQAGSPLESGVSPQRRRGASLAVKLIVCIASTLTLLGGALAFQQTKRAPAKDAQPSAQRQTDNDGDDRVERPTSNPYTGSLSIFEDPKREEKLQINRVMDLLKIKEGSGVADIGAGSGWFSVRAARRVGSTGAVYAVDINRDYLKYIEERAKKEGLPQVRTILGEEDDPLLPARSTDAVLILKTYHEIAEPVRLMKNLRAALRDGALVGIIDRNGRGDDHGLDQSVVVKELERAGYRLVDQYDFVKPDGMDYFLIFGVSK
jgi:SAM-dependent methyltransferase